MNELYAALAGALAGVIGSNVFSLFSERRLWSREDRLRYHERRLEASADLLASARDLSFNCYEGKRLSEEEIYRYRQANGVLMLLSPDLNEPLKEVDDVIRECLANAGKFSNEERELSSAKMAKALTNFVVDTSKSLDIPFFK